MKTLSEIVDDTQKAIPSTTKAQVAAIAAQLVDRIASSLINGNDVRIHNLGTFTTKRSEARAGRNPATGEPVQIAAKTSVKFKAAKALADAVA